MRTLMLAAAALLITATPAVAAEKVTRNGVGDVEVGASYRSLRDAGLVGKTQPGCELEGPGRRVAPLKAPLRGFAQLDRQRRVEGVYVTRGATARGVGVGDRLRKLRRAYDTVRVDRSTEETFGIALATIPRSSGGRIQFAIGAKNGRVQGIGVPIIPFCE